VGLVGAGVQLSRRNKAVDEGEAAGDAYPAEQQELAADPASEGANTR
jgi:hypothetical protein